jgi:glycosyltransferase involved in cell wall biosynthesis
MTSPTSTSHPFPAAPATPRLSVIVPVRNRRDLLAGLLSALDAQTYPDFEVIVIDDGSTDGADQLAASRQIAGRPVKLLRSHGAGAVVARTLGVQASTAEVLAFTDSDCVPAPDWLATGMAAIDEGADVVNGLTQPARPMRPLERSVGSGTEGLYPTCNMFYRRDVFDRAGGFDHGAATTLGFRFDGIARGTGFGEDTMLAWRAHRQGATVRHVPEALVQHYVFPPDFRDWLSRCWQVGAFPALVRDAPELRGTIMRYRLFFGSRSRIPVYVLIGTLLTRRRLPVALVVGWWALLRWQDLRSCPVSWKRRLLALPLEMTVDAVTSAAYAAGSVRARTIVL